MAKPERVAQMGMTRDDAINTLLDTDPRFAVTTTKVRGQTYKVFKNAPGSVAELLECGRDLRDPNEPYLYFEDEVLSYDGFRAHVYRLARALRDHFNVSPGTRVGVCSKNSPEMLAAILAISAAGGVVVFLNSWWTTAELEHAVETSQTKLILCDGDRCRLLLPLQQAHRLTFICYRDPAPDGAHALDAVLQQAKDATPLGLEIDTDSDFAIMYTSGSSGTPKGVQLTHRGAISATYSGLMLDEIAGLMAPPGTPKPGFHLMIVTPLFHVTATHPCFLWSLVSGAKLTVFPKWDAVKAVEAIRDQGITRIISVPTQSADLMEAAARMGESLPTLGSINSGGAKRPAAQVAQLAEAFPAARIGSGYGMTETNALGMLCAGPDYLARPDTCGRLIPPLQEARFLDDVGNDVPKGTVGELALRGPHIMRGYLNNPQATAEVLQDGWFRTGDLARIDDEGFIYIVDRKKDIIIRGGENIACLEVDGALHKDDNIAEGAVFSVPDERLGEIVGAGIWPKPGCSVTTESLKTALKPHLASFKIPARVWVMDGPLPRTPTDKIDRRALRARCLNAEGIAE